MCVGGAGGDFRSRPCGKRVGGWRINLLAFQMYPKINTLKMNFLHSLKKASQDVTQKILNLPYLC